MTVASAFVAFFAYPSRSVHDAYLRDTGKNGQTQVRGSGLLGIHSSDHLGSILNGLLGVESTLHVIPSTQTVPTFFPVIP